MMDNDNSISNNKGKDVVSGTNTETGDCVLNDPNELIKTLQRCHKHITSGAL